MTGPKMMLMSITVFQGANWQNLGQSRAPISLLPFLSTPREHQKFIDCGISNETQRVGNISLGIRFIPSIGTTLSTERERVAADEKQRMEKEELNRIRQKRLEDAAVKAHCAHQVNSLRFLMMRCSRDESRIRRLRARLEGPEEPHFDVLKEGIRNAAFEVDVLNHGASQPQAAHPLANQPLATGIVSVDADMVQVRGAFEEHLKNCEKLAANAELLIRRADVDCRGETYSSQSCGCGPELDDSKSPVVGLATEIYKR